MSADLDGRIATRPATEEERAKLVKFFMRKGGMSQERAVKAFEKVEAQIKGGTTLQKAHATVASLICNGG